MSDSPHAPTPHPGDVVVACLRADHWRRPPASLAGLVSRVDRDAVARAAAVHGVSGYVFRALSQLGAADLAPRLEAAYHGALRDHLRTVADLAALAPALEATGEWAVLKGPVLAARLHEQPGLRRYGDLDLLVRPADLPAALAALEACGARPAGDDWGVLRRDGVGEVALTLPSGTVVDLHWDVVNEARVRRAFDLPAGALLARSRRVELGGVEVRTLDPVDTLLHLCLHACLGGGQRLVWLKDVERAAAAVCDWDEVVARARASRTALVAAVTLSRAHHVLGALVPAGVVDALAPRLGWRALAAASARARPPQRSDGGPSWDRMLCRATRATTAASVAELARRASAAARERLDSRPHAPPPPAAPGARRAYLSWVAGPSALGWDSGREAGSSRPSSARRST
ncbi:MAG TPA: nucleotidyltransferase family protein [Egibacteraceae bacterium]